MTKQANPQSLKRNQESLASLFKLESSSPHVLFIKSSTDIGVERNGGRNGARLAPRSLLSSFKKLTKDSRWEDKVIHEFEVAEEELEKSDFISAQITEAEKIAKLLKESPTSMVCHLGGGHDHVFPFLKALFKQFSRVIVINIDAHADTRTDSAYHSGTPFRQFSEVGKDEFHIYQIGLHAFANSLSTLSSLTPAHSHVIWRKDLSDKNKITAAFKSIASLITDKTAVVFSLDADALDGPHMPGVSAVNGSGLSISELELLWKEYLKLPLAHPPLMGVYELNPVYDSLSMLSMRTVANFIFESLASR